MPELCPHLFQYVSAFFRLHNVCTLHLFIVHDGVWKISDNVVLHYALCAGVTTSVQIQDAL